MRRIGSCFKLSLLSLFNSFVIFSMSEYTDTFVLQKHIQIPEIPTKSEVMYTFRSFNVREPLNILVMCSTSCVQAVLKCANEFDDLADQQGYFSYAHTWLVATRSRNPEILAQNVGHLNNVLYVDFSRVAVEGQESQECRVFTAIAQNEEYGPVFIDVGSCINNTIHNSTNLNPNMDYRLNKRHLIVSTNLWDPFMKKSINGSKITYSGLCMDLLETLADRLNFTYTLREPPDGKWGSFENGAWTGLVAELLYKNADLVVAPFSRTLERSAVIDFASQPFYIEYTGGLYRSPGKASRAWLLMQPFRWQVWVLLAFSVPVAAACLYIFTRVSPEEIVPEKNSSMATFCLCVMMSYGAMLTQGATHVPTSQSGRAFWGCYWFFCIIVVSIYSGNLIAFLAVLRPSYPFSTIEELVKNTEYKHGFLGGTAYIAYFNTTRSYPYTELWAEQLEFLKTEPRTHSSDHSEHMDRVVNEKYVYLTDKTSIDISIASNCDLGTLKEYVGVRFLYSVALRNNSAFSQLIGDAVVEAASLGLLEAWKRRNWPNTSSTCSNYFKLPEPSAGLEELYGAFMLLSCPLILATALFLVEVVISSILKQSRAQKWSPSTTEALLKLGHGLAGIKFKLDAK